MGTSSSVVLRMSAWANPRRELATWAALCFVCLCIALLILMPIFMVASAGLSWVSALFAAVLLIGPAWLALLARDMYAALVETRTGKQPGDLTVSPDSCRIRFPAVVATDLVIPSSQIRAVAVDERRPAWAILCWYRFPIASNHTGSGYVGCLFRSHLQNPLQLLGPAPAAPNVAILFTDRVFLPQLTGLGRVGESFAVSVAQHDDIESAADLPGARPLDPNRAHAGIFLRVDSPADARRAFANWPAMRQELQQADVGLLRPTPMPGVARQLLGALGLAWLASAFIAVLIAALTRSWSLLVPVVLLPLAMGGLAYSTYRSLRGLGRRKTGSKVALAVCALVVGVILGVVEIRDVMTFDDPPPSERPPTIYVPDDPFPSAPTPVPFPTQATDDPLRP